MTAPNEEPAYEPIGTTTTDQLASALATVVATGLPIDEAGAPTLLLDLRSVYARSVVPREPRSRLLALNELLPRLIAAIGDPPYRVAIQILFGLAPGTRGTKLMARRRQAADVLGYNATHLRTDIEPKLIRALASALHDDLLRYEARMRRSASSLEPSGDTPTLGPEHLNHEEEVVSRIWQHVYGLRAELIATLRLAEQPGYESQAEDHRQAAIRQESALKALIGEYTATYGQALIRHGDTEYSAEAIERLAGWTM